MKVLVTGPQGSGKSTQAVLLAQDLGAPYIQLGEMFRTIALIDNGKIVEQVKQALAKGELVPFDLTAKIVNKRLSQDDCAAGFVLDGFPRSKTDIQNLNQTLDYVINLKVSAEVGVKRLLARGRTDDTEELIKERLKNYYKETLPILEYFERSGVLVEVDGEKTVAQIHEDIVKRLRINDIH